MPSLGDSTSQTRRDDKTIALFQLSSRTFSQRKGMRGSQSVDIKSSTKPVHLLHLPVPTLPTSFSSAAQSKLYPALLNSTRLSTRSFENGRGCPPNRVLSVVVCRGLLVHWAKSLTIARPAHPGGASTLRSRPDGMNLCRHHASSRL